MSAGAPGFRRILCATDFSDASKHGWELAVRLAGQGGASVGLVHVVPEFSHLDALTGISDSMFKALTRAGRASARSRLQDFVERAQRSGVLARPFVGAGLPWEEILRIARTRKADLIVIGAHGRRASAGSGGVAERVVRFSSCPVLVARGRRPRNGRRK